MSDEIVMNPTDAQITERLARFCGWTKCQCGAPDCWRAPLNNYGPFDGAMPDFLNSRDALAPVLEELNAKQWTDLYLMFLSRYCLASDKECLIRMLTIPPRTLALALYEAIGD